MFKNRSKVLLVANILATAYVVYVTVYFFGGIASDSAAGQDGDAVVGAIATAIVMPHLIANGVGVIFGWVGFLLKNNWGPLVGAILYSVGLVLFPMYFMFSIPIIVFGFIGFAKQRKINSLAKQGITAV